MTVNETADETQSTSEVSKEVLGWLEFGDAARHLAGNVVESGFQPDVVIAIARGGLLLAGAISYALGVKACGSLNVEYYTDGDLTLAEPVILPPLLDHGAMHSRRVLLVDDVSDSGRTLSHVLNLLQNSGAAVRTACLYTKPRTILKPDFYWRKTDLWITFPWSALPPVTMGIP